MRKVKESVQFSRLAVDASLREDLISMVLEGRVMAYGLQTSQAADHRSQQAEC